MFLKESRTRTF